MRIATLAFSTTAIGPEGRGLILDAGRYPVCDLDGTEPGLVYLGDPADPRRIVGCVQKSDIEVMGEDG